jgi:hypothetical protein
MNVGYGHLYNYSGGVREYSLSVSRACLILIIEDFLAYTLERFCSASSNITNSIKYSQATMSKLHPSKEHQQKVCNEMCLI